MTAHRPRPVDGDLDQAGGPGAEALELVSPPSQLEEFAAV
jgi:hypothetical protein